MLEPDRRDFISTLRFEETTHQRDLPSDIDREGLRENINGRKAMIQYVICCRKRNLWWWFFGCCVIISTRLLLPQELLTLRNPKLSDNNCDENSPSQLCVSIRLSVRPHRAYVSSLVKNSSWQNVNASIQQDVGKVSTLSRRRCALNFYGLPRAFKDMVLPSLIANVIIPNAQYDCDYFVHFYNVTYEPPSRSGKGGIIVPEDVYLLRLAVHNEALRADRPLPHVGFKQDTVEAFELNQSDILRQIRQNGTAEKNPFHGKEKTFTVETYINIIKMWYSIAAVWESMKTHASSRDIKYERVAMMRSDVVYVTPIDIFRAAPSSSSSPSSNRFDAFNNQSVIPGFAQFPVNDRMFYGPYEAAEIWATGRFSRLEDFVYRDHRPLNSEHFLAAMVLPAIREHSISVGVDPGICFLRARADGSVWNDCKRKFSKIRLEKLLNISCDSAFDVMTSVPIFRCSMLPTGIEA